MYKTKMMIRYVFRIKPPFYLPLTPKNAITKEFISKTTLALSSQGRGDLRIAPTLRGGD
jgi:hypothetical protein